MSPPPLRGEVWAARLGPVEGSEQRGTRPVLIVSNDLFNEAVPLVTIVPLTTLRSQRRVYRSEVRVPRGTAALRVESLALCQQLRTIARTRLGRRLGRLEPDLMTAVDEALRLHLDLTAEGSAHHAH